MLLLFRSDRRPSRLLLRCALSPPLLLWRRRFQWRRCFLSVQCLGVLSRRLSLWLLCSKPHPLVRCYRCYLLLLYLRCSRWLRSDLYRVAPLLRCALWLRLNPWRRWFRHLLLRLILSDQ